MTRGHDLERLTLADALRDGRLDDFAMRAEAEGVGPADRAEFDAMVGRITAPLPEDRTSRLPARGSKRGK